MQYAAVVPGLVLPYSVFLLENREARAGKSFAEAIARG
jgi:hypothetical protein